MSTVTTHVLDTALGQPAAGVPVSLERLDAALTTIAEGATDGDGRVGELGPDRLEPGPYQLSFDTDAYFAATGRTGFFPEVTIAFTIADGGEHYHVPLLLSPFSYSTYRGS
ncbi:MAG: hydroxyisourate hydrolase [Actinomycetia bacterium]|nr:hydroxyisourate hydrolase [Actinomycetes bacterium]